MGALQDRKYERDYSRCDECSRPEIPDCDQHGLAPVAVRAGQRRRTHNEDEHRNQDPEQHHLQHKLIDREERRADEMTPWAETAGDQHRRSALFENLRDLVLAESVAKLGFLVFNLRAEVFPHLSKEILLAPGLRQPEANGLQVTVNKL